jgi:hypothetical protein
MSGTWFAVLFIIALLAIAGVGFFLLIWPSKFLRHVQNPIQPDTPVNRVYMRAVGIYLCLFPLLIVSGSIKILEGVHRNILVALWAPPVILPIFLWSLWRYSALPHVNRRYLAGGADHNLAVWLGIRKH